jgi:hypothetical protein
MFRGLRRVREKLVDPLLIEEVIILSGLQSLRVHAEACLVWSSSVPLRLLDRFAADNQMFGAAAATLNISSAEFLDDSEIDWTSRPDSAFRRVFLCRICSLAGCLLGRRLQRLWLILC